MSKRFPLFTVGVPRLFTRVLPLALVLVMNGWLVGCSPESSGDAAVKPKGANAPSHLVELAPVTKEVLQFTADREGSLRAVREVKLFNQEEGRVTALRVREGDAVRANQVLVRLDDRLLRAELDKAAATLRQANLDVQRLQQLMAKKLISEDALTRAQTSLEIARAQERVLRTRLGYMTIRAPFAGKIAERRIEPGDVAPKHTHLLTLIDPSELVTDVQISELVLPRIKVGDRADVRIDALGEQAYPGRVLRIYPTVDPATRRGQIEVGLKPVPKGARPGQFSRMTLYAAGRERLVIPQVALRRDAKGEYVFLFRRAGSTSVAGAGTRRSDRRAGSTSVAGAGTRRSDRASGDVSAGGPERPRWGKVKRLQVVSGLKVGDKVEIRDGLEAGQQVVSKGFIGLADGQSVRPVKRASERGKAPEGGKSTGANDA